MSTISFLASHGGTAVKAVISAIQARELNCTIGVVITNNRDSEIYDWCEKNAVPVFHISGKTHPNEKEKDLAIKHTLEDVGSEIIVLSGYMKKIGEQTLTAFENKILNIHPSLLPKHGGRGMFGDKVHESVLESGDLYSGASVQLINSEYDQGPVIAQEKVPVLPDDTIETLKERVRAIEGWLYINAIKKIA